MIIQLATIYIAKVTSSKSMNTYLTRQRASTSMYSLTFRHSNATSALIANPPNSAQLGDIPYNSPKLHPGPCNSVGMQLRTDTQTDRHTQTRVTTIHFTSSTTHEKCNNYHTTTMWWLVLLCTITKLLCVEPTKYWNGWLFALYYLGRPTQPPIHRDMGNDY